MTYNFENTDEIDDIDTTDSIIENYFFIDYENVNKDGLNGIGHLTENDCVRVYYSDNAQTLSWGLHRRINSCNAKFEYAKIETYGIENAIDMHILMDIKQAYNSNKNTNFYIISYDHDFDKAIEDYCRKGIKVNKLGQICESYNPLSVKSTKIIENKKKEISPDKTKEQMIRSIFGRSFKVSPYRENKEQIINILLSSTDKQSLNNSLTRIIPSNAIPMIREEFKEIISILPSGTGNKVLTDDNLNNTIQKLLSKANFDKNIPNHVASLVCKHKGDKNTVYKALVMKYGEGKGLNIYNHIKKYI